MCWSQPVYPSHHQDGIAIILQWLRMRDDIMDGGIKGRSVFIWQPELGVVGKCSDGTVVVKVRVGPNLVGFVPLLKGTIDTLHDIVHDASIGRVTDE